MGPFIGPARVIDFIQVDPRVTQKSKRKAVVLGGMAAFLILTSALLLVLAPPPLTPLDTLSAADHADFLGAVFKTAVPTQTEQWKYIFIHQSATPSGNAATLATPLSGLCDHFVIGNGDGCQDGEIQMGARWNSQQPAAAQPGVDKMDPACISICVVGDFDNAMPTPTQLRRLAQLVGTLQTQLRIHADNVVMLPQSASSSGIGRFFPVTAFRDQIQP
jgi:N-acetylmuramoyl-L-alanine amidase